jgi:3',5'-cyclic AMP phosphodiesterase CpdA
MHDFRRRQFLAVAAGAGVAMAAPPAFSSRAFAAEAQAKAERAFRFVHFGDTHVGNSIPFCTTDDGYPKAIRHVHAIADAPQFILHTGDIITDAFWAKEESANQQWAAYHAVMTKHCKLPVRYTLGNHDVNFGWDLGDARTPHPGKITALRQLGMNTPYYSFDHGGWHFIVLDNTQRGGWNGFQISLDDAQFAWLEKDLKTVGAGTPVVVASHAPILTITCFFEPLAKKHPDGLVMSNDCVHQDVVKIFNLFRQHPNIKLCLSGHYHQVDHCQYLGIHFICGGAVCADYWRRPLPYRTEHEAGYGVVDLYKGGTFDYRYVDYGLVGYLDKADRPRFPWAKA